MAETIKIGGELESMATGNVVAAASAIKDKVKNKYQGEINAETDATLTNHASAIQGLNSQNYVTVTATDQTTAVTDVLPAQGVVNTVYRVGNWDGSQFDETSYSEYAWNGSTYVHITTKIQISEVFDISAYHATGGELAKYADLAAALGTNGVNVPQSLRKGGMSVKFVCSSDNNYVQYSFLLSTFTDAQFANPANWQIVDNNILTNYHEINCIGNTLVWITDSFKVVPNHIYRIKFEDTATYDSTGLTGYGFLIGKTKDVSNIITTYAPNKIPELIATGYIDVEVPADTYNIYLSAKGKSGYVFKLSFEDITYAHNKVDAPNEIRSYLGKGNTLAWYNDSIPVIAGHTYRFNIVTNVFDKTGLTGYIFVVSPQKDASSVIFSAYTNSTGLDSYYDITIPNGVSEIYVGGRYTNSSEFKFSVEDVSDAGLSKSNASYPFTDGYGYNIGSAGSSPIYGAITGNSCLKIPVKSGETFNIKGSGGVLSMLWATCSVTNAIMRSSGASVSNNGTGINVTIQDGEEWLIVNSSTTTQHSVCRINNAETITKLIGEKYNERKYLTLRSVVSTSVSAVKVDKVPLYVIPEHKYRIYINNPLVDMTGTTGSLAFMVSTDTDGVNTIYSLSLTDVAYGWEKYYDVDIPKNITEVYWGVKCAIGAEFGISVEDVTELGYFIASTDSSEEDKAKADYIINTNTAAQSLINNRIATHKVIYLLGGTYNTTGTININYDDRKIIGVGNVTINRNPISTGLVITTGPAVKNTYVENIKCNGVILLNSSGAKNGRVVNCTFDTSRHINDLTVGISKKIDINCGIGQNVESFDDAYYFAKLFKARICIFGLVEMTSNVSYVINKTVEIEGMTNDAELRMNSTACKDGFQFDDGVGIAGRNYSKVRNILFTQYGEVTGYQIATVCVNGNYVKFYNCIFKNFTSTSRVYDPSLDLGNTAEDGDRRHGMLLMCPAQGDENQVEIHNCEFYGSPYGLKNTRGLYVAYGSPKIYNCKFVGGGIGRKGFGIVCHASSTPIIYDSIGIGSPYGWAEAHGMQFQSNTRATIINCIGYGGTGYRYKSNGGTDMVKQDELTTESFGFGFNTIVNPTLINCIGYAGDGEDSGCIKSYHSSSPDFIGGYFGKQKMMYDLYFAGHSDGSYVNLAGKINDNRKVHISQIAVRDMANMETGQRVVIKTESGVLIGETDRIDSEIIINIQHPDIDANDNISVHVYDATDQDVVGYAIRFHCFFQYTVENEMCFALVQSGASPRVENAVFEGNSLSDGVVFDSDATSTTYLFDKCTIKTPSTRNAVKAGAAKSNARFVDCVFTSQLTDNINSFISPTALGSNRVI